MEFSLKCIQQITKNALLKDEQTNEAYEYLKDNIIKAVRKGYKSLKFTIDAQAKVSIGGEVIELPHILDAIEIIKIDGFNVNLHIIDSISISSYDISWVVE